MLNSFVIRKDKKIPGSDAMSVFILRPWNLQVSCKYRTLEDSCNFSIISWPLALDAPLTVVKPGSLLPFRTWRLCLKELPFIWGLSRVSPKYMEISSFGQNLSRNVRKSSPKSHDVRPRDFVTVSIRLKTWVVVSIIFYVHPDPWGIFPIWLIFFRWGWNHQLETHSLPWIPSRMPLRCVETSPVDTPWPRLGGKLYVAGGYGPQEFCWQQKMRPALKFRWSQI